MKISLLPRFSLISLISSHLKKPEFINSPIKNCFIFSDSFFLEFYFTATYKFFIQKVKGKFSSDVKIYPLFIHS